MGELNVRTSLGIPELHLAIESGTEELCAVVVKRDVVHRFRVAHEGAQTFTFVVDVPQLPCGLNLEFSPGSQNTKKQDKERNGTNLDPRIKTRTQQQMATLGKELNLANALGMSAPGVDTLLGHEAFLKSGLGGLEVDVDVGRDVQVGAPEIVV